MIVMKDDAADVGDDGDGGAHAKGDGDLASRCSGQPAPLQELGPRATCSVMREFFHPRILMSICLFSLVFLSCFSLVFHTFCLKEGGTVGGQVENEYDVDAVPFQARFLLQELIFAHCAYLQRPYVRGNLLCRADWLSLRGLRGCGVRMYHPPTLGICKLLNESRRCVQPHGEGKGGTVKN